MPARHADVALTLYCLPYAGGNAATYRGWGALLGPRIECVALDLPGHGRLRATPALADWPALIDALLANLDPLPTRPFAFFGHSMGALVAFELARALRRERLPLPQTIVVSGRRAPTVPNNEPPLHVLSDPDFVEALVRRYDAIPKVIRDEPDLMALFIPVMKADFATFETHVHRDEPPLECALSIYGGRDDPQTRQMTGWTDLFDGPVATRLFDGGHFYLADQRRAVAAALAEDVLAPVAAA